MKAKRLLMALFAIVFTASTALAEILSGSCGDNATYTLDTEAGLLKIEGAGAMKNYYSEAPWYSIRSVITKVEIADGITSIGDRAFEWCSSLTSVSIPNSVTSIGYNAFYGCFSQTFVTIPESVTSIGYNAFYMCYFATENFKNKSCCTSGDNWGATLCDVEQDDGLMIKNNVAVFCRRWATSVTIPESVTSIGGIAFDGCSSLTSVIIPTSVTCIEVAAFSDCSRLTSVTIPNSVTSIGERAFEGCSSLTSISISNSVNSIGSEAFNGCTGLTSVIIPSNVTSIGGSAFNGCRLRSVVSKVENPTTAFSMPFSDATLSHTPLYIPAGSYWNYIYDCDWYKFNNIKEFVDSSSDISESKAYMIADANGFNYTVFEDGRLKNIEYTHELDERELGSCWQIKENGTRRYLYSPAAGRYATMQDGKLQLTAAPVDIELSEQDGSLSINGTKCMLVLNKEVENVIDGIDSLTPDSSAQSGEIYDLQGRRIQKPAKGLYIQNGKKMLMK